MATRPRSPTTAQLSWRGSLTQYKAHHAVPPSHFGVSPSAGVVYSVQKGSLGADESSVGEEENDCVGESYWLHQIGKPLSGNRLHTQLRVISTIPACVYLGHVHEAFMDTQNTASGGGEGKGGGRVLVGSPGRSLSPIQRSLSPIQRSLSMLSTTRNAITASSSHHAGLSSAGSGQSAQHLCVVTADPGKDALTLKRYISKHGPMSAGAVMRMLTQLCCAVAALQSAGLAHNCIHPGVVFVKLVPNGKEEMKKKEEGEEKVEGEQEERYLLMDYTAVDRIGEHAAGEQVYESANWPSEAS